jgi:hypothetical protein
LRLVAGSIALGLLHLDAFAHHSVGATYDVAALATIVGTISKVEIRNPHVRIELAAFDESGRARTWLVEMAGPSALARRGVDSRVLLTVGLRVTIEAWFAKDGSLSASAHMLVTPSGERFDVTDNWLVDADAF